MRLSDVAYHALVGIFRAVRLVTRQWWAVAALSAVAVLLFAFTLWAATPAPLDCPGGSIEVATVGDPHCVEVRP